MRGTTKVQAALFGLVALLALQLVAVATEAWCADGGFSFAVYGDSRSMFYLPYKSDQEAERLANCWLKCLS
jgi:hypothetical protein